jgi:kumamolisin
MAERARLEKSTRGPVPGARRLGPTDPERVIEITLVLERTRPVDRGAVTEMGARAPVERAHLTYEQLAEQHHAPPDAVAAVRAFARAFGLRAGPLDALRNTVTLRGRVADMERAFETRLHDYECDGVQFRQRLGDLTVPAEIAPYVAAVLGLDDRPQARSHMRRAVAGSGGFTPQQVAELYGFPDSDGADETIGIIELGGALDQGDLDTYFASVGLPGREAVTSVFVAGARPRRYGANADDDSEVMLDIEVAGAVAPKAKIVVYSAHNTDRGFYEALSQAVYDREHRPSVISISWGAFEASYTEQTRAAFDELAASAALLGITVLAASGDDGASDQTPGDGFERARHVDFPAAVPHVLACGGTSVRARQGRIVSETVWRNTQGASGGGVSTAFGVPAWQSGLSAGAHPLTGRGVPDVAGNGDPNTGYKTFHNGGPEEIGGTSAVAPLWAALIARINARLRARCGFVTPLLYGAARQAEFRDIVHGDNSFHGVDGFVAKPGWDACTGLGSPNGAALLRLFASHPGSPDARGRARAVSP